MGSMGESDRKRRHFSSLSPTPAAATAKKLPFLPISEDKKLDISVLQKLKYAALENKFSQLKERQQSYDSTSAVVKDSWELENKFSQLKERQQSYDSTLAVARILGNRVLSICHA